MQNASTISFELDRESETPLYAQIRDRISAAIDAEVLRPGDRIPAVTTLAEQLGVTASTVLRAFEDLVRDRLLVARVGRGTFVTERPCESGRQRTVGSGPGSPVPRAAADDTEHATEVRRLRMGASSSLDALMTLTERPGLIRFTSGVPDPALVEDGLLRRLTQEVASGDEDPFKGYSPPGGMPELREAVAERLRSAGPSIGPEQVLITSGSQQAIAILAQSALESGRRVVVEMPCYMGIPRAFGAVGHWVETVTRDAEGPLPDDLAACSRPEQPPLLYLCPELHNPQGTDLSPSRREVLGRWATEQDALLVADEIFHDLRFEGSAPPSLLTGDTAGRTVVVGSLSKSFMCGLRIGWLVADREQVRSLIALKRAMDIGCPPLTQAIAARLLRSGAYDTHLEQVRTAYRERRDATIEALEAQMPDGVTWTRPPGGFHMWLELPEGHSSVALLLLAVERGVAFIPGPQLDVDHRFTAGLRLSYGSLEPGQIADGIERLAGAVRRLLRHTPVAASMELI